LVTNIQDDVAEISHYGSSRINSAFEGRALRNECEDFEFKVQSSMFNVNETASL